jgi:chemotaxis protein MotA
MDLATIIGLVVALGMILYGILMGSPLSLFWDLPSALIVIGGTLGIVFINFPFKDIGGVIGVIKNAFKSSIYDPKGLITAFVTFATKARREGILALESAATDVKDPFLKQGLELVIDGLEPQSIRDILESEMENLGIRHKKGTDILNSIATYAPAMGMVGTLIGLVQMLQSMNDPSSIGPAMAVALITTFYGALIANLFALPMAGKLSSRSNEEMLIRGIIVEGIMSISAGDNPRIVERKLHAYLAPRLRDREKGKSREEQ